MILQDEAVLTTQRWMILVREFQHRIWNEELNNLVTLKYTVTLPHKSLKYTYMSCYIWCTPYLARCWERETGCIKVDMFLEEW